jgi:tRNA pseudouridine38-40 synthase
LPRYLLTVEYVGTEYHGFQRQAGLATVQGALEQAVTSFSGREVFIQGAGRTDAGVHAVGQAAAFDLPDEVDEYRYLASLNALLPRGIAVTAMQRVRDDLDPRRGALWREYRYFILNRTAPSAILEAYTHHALWALDRQRIRAACALFVGDHDFSAFRVKGTPEEHGLRKVLECELTEPCPELLCIRVKANAFLYRMVRIMVGAIEAVGRGRMDLEQLEKHLGGGDRPCADPLGARGLFLWQVSYPEDAFKWE